jgi:hypothetical protein
MPQPRNDRNSKNLWGLIVVAVAMRLIFYIWPHITGSPEADGLLAVSLGFYICSRAAANFLTVILYELSARRWVSLTRPDIAWLGLNALVMLSGLMLVVTGIYRFFSRVF